jgi:hypothetical protein
LRKLNATKTTKTLFAVAMIFVALSLALGVAGNYTVTTNQTETIVIIDDTFMLTQNTIRRQGIGACQRGENITVTAESPANFSKKFTIESYSGIRFENISDQNVNYSFTASQEYYEVVFYTQHLQATSVHFKVTVQQFQVNAPFSWVSQPAKVLFMASLALALILILKQILKHQTVNAATKPSLPFISSSNRHRIIGLLVLSLILWLVLVALNGNPLGTLENWYTDHARHSYASSLFLKDGFAVFSQSLDTLASQDSSAYKFITWPEMPHLYPLGSIILFLPFSAFLQTGATPILIYKLEIATFLVIAHICLYFFLKVFLKRELEVFWKLVGIYIIYMAFTVYAADGMFDSVAFIFSLFAVTMLLSERYDAFFVLIAASVFVKYQTGIFLLPLMTVGILKLLQQEKFSNLIRNKAVILGFILFALSLSTAYLSAPYLLQTRPELIMNGVIAFSQSAQVPWAVQSLAVLLTLTASLSYVFYMRNRNMLLSMSALFLLLPSFTLPYFQNWYIPFIFIYILIPQTKSDIKATMLWLIFMIVVLSFGGSAFDPSRIIDNIKTTLSI